MDFQEVLTCLQDREKCGDFILRLKNAGEHSQSFLHVQKAMVELGMHKAPKGIDQETMLQHTFRFLKAEESFESFRLVSKTWKHAVETMRFDQELRIADSDQPNFSPKYLQAFKKLIFTIKSEGDEMRQLLVNNMKKLNSLTVVVHRCFIRGMLGDEFSTNDEEQFVTQMVDNSHQTLKKLRVPTLQFSHLPLPNLEELELSDKHITLQHLEKHFPQALENMSSLRVVKLKLFSDTRDTICKHIVNKYPKNCIMISLTIDFGFSSELLNRQLNAKIITAVYYIEDLDNKSSTNSVEYLHCYFYENDPMGGGWDRYRDIFDQCPNLRAIEAISSRSRDVTILDMPTHSPDEAQIWNERITYFTSRGIKLVKEGEIYGNEELQMKLAKEAGIDWILHLH